MRTIRNSNQVQLSTPHNVSRETITIVLYIYTPQKNHFEKHTPQK